MPAPPDKQPLFDWTSLQQIIISVFRGFGNLFNYWSLDAEDKDRYRRVNGWVSNKALNPRPEDEKYYWELEEEQREKEMAEDKEMAEGVIEEFDDLLKRYAEEHEDFELPEKYSDEWYAALEKANTFFTDRNKEKKAEYHEAVETYKEEQAARKEEVQEIKREQRLKAKETHEHLKRNGNYYEQGSHYRNPRMNGPFLPISLHDNPLLRTIRELESDNNPNAIYKWTGTPLDLSSMTIGEIIDWQHNNPHKTAKGEDFYRPVSEYQFKPSTLEFAMKLAKISPDEQFTQDVRDRLAYTLAVFRGYDDFINGKISMDEFVGGFNADHKDGLAGEWAVLPYDKKGLSAYGANGIDEARISWDDLESVLEECKKQHIANDFALGFPVDVRKTNSPLGWRKLPGAKRARPHRGEDFPVEKDTEVKAIASGVVTNIRTSLNENGVGYGKTITLTHFDSEGKPVGVSMYAHLNGYPDDIKVGDTVERGQTIAFSGDSGSQGSNHLHMETGVYIKDKSGNLQLCMVSFSDMLEIGVSFEDVAAVPDLVDRALIRHRGNDHYYDKDGNKLNTNGVLCSWFTEENIPLNLRPDPTDVNEYDFVEAKKRLASYISASTGYKVQERLGDKAFPEIKYTPVRASASHKTREIKENSRNIGEPILLFPPIMNRGNDMNLEA